jgi:hypothetical protein
VGRRPARKLPSPELVVLLKTPQVISTRYLQEAVEHAFGVSLTTGEPQATEFVTGESPVFFVQFGGRLLQVIYSQHPYFDAICRPFTAGIPEALLRRAAAEGIGGDVQGCRGWIGVTFMATGQRPQGEDPYEYVARLLGALAAVEEEAVAVIWPARNEIRQYDGTMADKLQEGDSEGAFRC